MSLKGIYHWVVRHTLRNSQNGYTNPLSSGPEKATYNISTSDGGKISCTKLTLDTNHGMFQTQRY